MRVRFFSASCVDDKITLILFIIGAYITNIFFSFEQILEARAKRTFVELCRHCRVGDNQERAVFSGIGFPITVSGMTRTVIL